MAQQNGQTTLRKSVNKGFGRNVKKFVSKGVKKIMAGIKYLK